MGCQKNFGCNRFSGFAKFAVGGASTAVVYFFVLWLLEAVFRVSYFFAVSAAYLISTLFNFYFHRNVTFSAVNSGLRRQVGRYIVMWAVNYLITILLVSACVEVFELSPYVGVFVSVSVTLWVGFLLGRAWVFKIGGN